MTDFVDITSNDNWFKQHPEKIAGVEVKTTSLLFPIQVKGNKEDVLRVTGATINNKNSLKSELKKTKKASSSKFEIGQKVLFTTKPLIIVNKKLDRGVWLYSANDGQEYTESMLVSNIKNDNSKGKKLKLAKAKAKALKLKLKLL